MTDLPLASSQVFLLPSRRNARLVLPGGGNWRQRWRASAWLPAYRLSARVWRTAVGLRFAVNPRLFSFEGPDTAVDATVAQAVRIVRCHVKAHQLAIRIGTADARQKLTLLMLDDQGGLCRVAKVGHLPLARRLVDHEAEVLQALPEGLGPKLLWSGDVTESGSMGVGEYGSGEVMAHSASPPAVPAAGLGRAIVFEPVQGRGLPARLPRSPSGKEWHEIDAFLARLAAVGQREPTTEGTEGTESDASRDGTPINPNCPRSTVRRPSAHPLPPHPPTPTLPRLGAHPLSHPHTPLLPHSPNSPSCPSCLRGERCFPAGDHPALLRLLPAHEKAGVWIAALAGRDWPVVIEHGDFAPWNLLRIPDGLRAIDWEDGRLEGFPAFDLVHYVIQVGVLMHRWPAGRIYQYAVERLQVAGFQAEEARAVVKLAALQDYIVTAPGEQGRLQDVRRRIMGA